MKTKMNLIVGVVMLLILSSCKTYFTEDIRKTVERKSTDRIEKVQFYNDREIEIVYKTKDATDKIEGGKVKFEAGYYYYYVTIPKHTKAQSKYRSSQHLNVFFDSGENSYLQFARNGRNQYQLAGNNTKDGFYVTFEDKQFKVLEGSKALLMIKKNYKEKTEVEKRKVKGVKVE